MVDDPWRKRDIVLDAAPLIYLAKLEALDVLATAADAAYVPAVVVDETTRPALALRHPDAIAIERAIHQGLLTVLDPTGPEQAAATEIGDRVPGLHAGECQVLAIALHRGIAAVIFERRAQRVARSMGAELVDIVELLVAGTSEPDLLEARIRGFGRLVELRLAALEALIERVRERNRR
jgi:predicted nucleic acid-binding protein